MVCISNPWLVLVVVICGIIGTRTDLRSVWKGCHAEQVEHVGHKKTPHISRINIFGISQLLRGILGYVVLI
jgi:hypothetical protein